MKRKRGKNKLDLLTLLVIILVILAVAVLILFLTYSPVMFAPGLLDPATCKAEKNVLAYWDLDEGSGSSAGDYIGDNPGTLYGDGCVGSPMLCEDISATSPEIPVECPPSMKAYWKFEEELDSCCGDYLGNYGAALYNMDAEDLVSGKLGNAYQFDSSGYAQADFSSAYDISKGSIGFWIKPHFDWGTDDDGGAHTFIDFTNDVDSDWNKNHLWVVYTNKRLEVLMAGSTSSDYGFASHNPGNLGSSDWHFIVVNWDNTQPQLDVYIDGDKGISDDSYTAPLSFNNPKLRIGNRGYTTPNSPADSVIDEVVIYDDILDPLIIADYYNAGAGKSYCNIDGAPPSTPPDVNESLCEYLGCTWDALTLECAGIPNPCNAFNTEPLCLDEPGYGGDTGCEWKTAGDLWTTGIIGNALWVENTTTFVNVPSLYNSNFPQDQGSLAMWVYLDDFNLNFVYLFDELDMNRDSLYMAVTGPNHIGVGYTQIGGFLGGIGQDFNPGWHFVVATWDSVNDIMHLYVDGQQIMSGVNLPVDWQPTDQFFTIGPVSPEYTNGNLVLDEVALFDNALDLGEVATYYNSGAGIHYCEGDICEIDIVRHEDNCKSNDYKVIWHEIIEDCGQDMSAYANTTEDCDYNGLGVVGRENEVETDNIETPIEIDIDGDEIDYDYNYTDDGELDVEIFDDDGNILLEFEYDFEDGPLNLREIVIEKQEDDSKKGSLLVGGLAGVEKTFYVDKVDEDSEEVCVRDREISVISTISTKCDKVSEVLVDCPGTEDDYDCDLDNDEEYFIVSGLTRSGVKEMLPGSGCSEEWSCTAWGTCSNDIQTRSCSCSCNNDGDCYGEHSEQRSCTAPLPCNKPWVCSEWGNCEDGWKYRTCDCDCDDSSDCYGDHEESRECGDTTWVWILIVVLSVLIIIIVVVIIILLSNRKKSNKGKTEKSETGKPKSGGKTPSKVSLVSPEPSAIYAR